MPWLEEGHLCCPARDRRIGGLRINFLGFGISLLCLGSSIHGLGSGILELKGSLWTLGLWQGLDLLALVLILWPRTTLANPLTLSHLSPLALVTSLARPFGNLSGRKRGLGDRGLLKGGWCRGNIRRECSWNFTNVHRVVNVLSLPPLESNKDSYQI